jgi:hypothetical protein
MAGAKLEPTRHPGIYKREGDRGTRYVVIYQDASGKQRKETAGHSTKPGRSSAVERTATRAPLGASRSPSTPANGSSGTPRATRPATTTARTSNGG